jgi:hypothetical protein
MRQLYTFDGERKQHRLFSASIAWEKPETFIIVSFAPPQLS